MNDDLPFRCPIQIRYADVDAMNHVNNAVYVSYLEVARVRLWKERFGFAGAADDIPFIVARVTVDYRRPISLLDTVEVAVGVTAIGTTSFTFGYAITADGSLAAEAETVQVHYDYESSRPTPIPETLRRQLSALRRPASR